MQYQKSCNPGCKLVKISDTMSMLTTGAHENCNIMKYFKIVQLDENLIYKLLMQLYTLTSSLIAPWLEQSKRVNILPKS